MKEKGRILSIRNLTQRDLFTCYVGLLLLLSNIQRTYCADDIYLGCYWDSPDRRSLSDLIFCPRSKVIFDVCQNECQASQPYCQSSTQMTPQICRDMCVSQNMRNYALQAGNQCFCGGDFADIDRSGRAANCDKPCSGDATQFCGGEYRLQVYEIQDSSSVCFHPGYAYNAANYEFLNGEFSAGDNLTFIDLCPDGYIHDGPVRTTCQASGTWSNIIPTCKAICEKTVPIPLFGQIVVGTENDIYVEGDTVRFSCEVDLLPLVEYTLRCDFKGDWAGAGLSVNCPRPPTSPPPTTTQATTPATTVAPTTVAPTTTLPSTTPTVPTTKMPTTERKETTKQITAAKETTLGIEATLLDATTEQRSHFPPVTIPPKRTGTPDVGGLGDIKDIIPYLIAVAALLTFIVVIAFVAGLTCGKTPKKRSKPHSSEIYTVNGFDNVAYVEGMGNGLNGSIISKTSNTLPSAYERIGEDSIPKLPPRNNTDTLPDSPPPPPYNGLILSPPVPPPPPPPGYMFPNGGVANGGTLPSKKPPRRDANEPLTRQPSTLPRNARTNGAPPPPPPPPAVAPKPQVESATLPSVLRRDKPNVTHPVGMNTPLKEHTEELYAAILKKNNRLKPKDSQHHENGKMKLKRLKAVEIPKKPTLSDIYPGDTSTLGDDEDDRMTINSEASEDFFGHPVLDMATRL